MKMTFDWKEYIETVRKAGAEGCVLLKNESKTLPVCKGEKVAVFGRTQFDYIKSGTGSGGLVNTPYVVNIYDGLKAVKEITVDESVADVYREWLKDHPFDKGCGWAQEPWSQDEMPVSDELASKASKENDIALIVIGRLAGEDKDNKNEEGSYLLRKDECALIDMVTRHFKRVAVVLNSGNIIDMKWVEKYNPSAVLYVWQGGCEGGNAVADVLTGKVNPCGRLADTIAYDISDYPSTDNFGDRFVAKYVEDIYVGYRYFETFAKDRVMFPFGYGLSYTEFEHTSKLTEKDNILTVDVTVKNVGDKAGREVAEVYFKAPKGKLGKADRELIRFAKTGVIAPGKEETVSVSFCIDEMCAFDDDGVSGSFSSFILEAGDYEIYEGKNVREAVLIGKTNVPSLKIVETVSDALAPKTPFDKLVCDESGKKIYRPVTLRRTSPYEHILEERKQLKEIPFAGSQKYKLKDVADGKITLDEFIAGLSDLEMIQMTRGEGMCSFRVTPGTAAAYAGVTDDLEGYGIPAICCTDGPSGLRLDSGAIAMQGPNGVALACTFDAELVEKVYELMGIELRYNKIDSLLGPGMNIHRNPLNGRNFEYFSEDPYLSGKMGASELKGLHKNKVTGTIKHFACNNQEIGRHSVDSIVSARALREIYLKGFEMAVKEGGAYNIMTTYGILNGTHTSSSFDLNVLVLRKDWKFEGTTETDWWSRVNDEDGESDVKFTSYMIRGGNDLFMVSKDSTNNGNDDDSEEGLKKGTFTRAELQRNVRNILKVALRTVAFDRLNGMKEEWDIKNRPASAEIHYDAEFAVEVDDVAVLPIEKLVLTKDAKNIINVRMKRIGDYELVLKYAGSGSGVEQSSVSFLVNNTIKLVLNASGADKEFKEVHLRLDTILGKNLVLTIAVAQAGIVLKDAEIKFIEK